MVYTFSKEKVYNGESFKTIKNQEAFMLDAVAIGELLIDFTPAPVRKEENPHFALNPGGAPANVMVAMQRLGAKTAFIGKVGEDSFGAFLKNTLAREGLETSGVIMDPETLTTLAFVTLDDRGDRSFSFYRNASADVMLEEKDVEVSLIERAGILHYGSVSFTDSPSKEASMYAVQKAQSLQKIISYDPNYRPRLWKDEKAAIESMQWGLSHADIVKVSHEEMELLTGEKEIEKGSKKLVEFGAQIVLVSAGEDGSYFATKYFVGHAPTYKVKTIDTNGAGDAFFGALLYQLKEKNKKELTALGKEEWEKYLLFANAAGSIATTKSGAIPALPTLQEVEDCMANQTLRIK